MHTTYAPRSRSSPTCSKGVAADDPRWDSPAGDIEWTCRYVAAHVADCGTWYAANLARQSTVIAECGEVAPTASAPVLVDALRSSAALLAAAVIAAGPDDRGCHPFGIADRSGFAAMGCDEVLVHGADLAAAFGLAYDPPRDVCERVLRRLFPWAPDRRRTVGRAAVGQRPRAARRPSDGAPVALALRSPRRVGRQAPPMPEKE